LQTLPAAALTTGNLLGNLAHKRVIAANNFLRAHVAEKHTSLSEAVGLQTSQTSTISDAATEQFFEYLVQKTWLKQESAL
jgi:hypothetical protein